MQLGLFALVFVAGVVGFAIATRGIEPRLVALTTGPYLGAVVLAQLGVVPVYLATALGAAALSTPLLRWRRRRPAGPWRLVLDVLLADAVLGVLALGPCLLRGPGLLDVLARKLAPFAPHADLYVLFRWHLVELLTALFVAVSLAAVAFWAALALKRLGPLARRALWLGLLGVSVGALAIRARPARAAHQPVGKLNVLVLASDSLRFDRLGVHGASRTGLTPHLDAFAKEAIDVQNVHVATASTLESWVTFFTGRFPPTHGIRAMYPRQEQVRALEQSPDLLPKLLARAGYDTLVSSDWVGNCFSLVNLGFSHARVAPVQSFRTLLLEGTLLAHPLVPLVTAFPLGQWLMPNHSSLATAIRPAVLAEQLFDDIDESVANRRPFFGLLFVSPTHLPYNASYPFNVRYVDPTYDGPHRYQIDVRAHELITTGFSPTLPPQAVQHVRDLYDGAVSEFDDSVGQVLRMLEERGLSKDTIVIVTSDHGEDLYDPGSTLGHGTNFFGGDQSTHIPFLIRVPTASGWLRPGSAVSALARNADLAPTLLELLGLSAPASMEGVSLAPLLRGEVQDLDLVAFAETCYLFFPKSKALTVLSEAERAEVYELQGAADTLEVDPAFDDNLVLRKDIVGPVVAAKDRMVRTRRWKLIEIPGKHHPIERLYDLDADPHQQHDLSGAGLPVQPKLEAALHAYWDGRGAGLRWPVADEAR